MVGSFVRMPTGLRLRVAPYRRAVTVNTTLRSTVHAFGSRFAVHTVLRLVRAARCGYAHGSALLRCRYILYALCLPRAVVGSRFTDFGSVLPFTRFLRTGSRVICGCYTHTRAVAIRSFATVIYHTFVHAPFSTCHTHVRHVYTLHAFMRYHYVYYTGSAVDYVTTLRFPICCTPHMVSGCRGSAHLRYGSRLRFCLRLLITTYCRCGYAHVTRLRALHGSGWFRTLPPVYAVHGWFTAFGLCWLPFYTLPAAVIGWFFRFEHYRLITAFTVVPR